MSRLIDANAVVKAILAERDKIPRTVPTAPYELGTEKPYHAGDQMRGGIRKALRCIEQAPTVDAVPVVRCRECVGRPFWGKGHNDVPVCLLSGLYVKSEDDFCPYGDRRGDSSDEQSII